MRHDIVVLYYCASNLLKDLRFNHHFDVMISGST